MVSAAVNILFFLVLGVTAISKTGDQAEPPKEEAVMEERLEEEKKAPLEEEIQEPEEKEEDKVPAI